MTVRDTSEWIWSKPWIAMWAVNVAALLIGAFLLPFGTWAVAATILFGVPEAFSLWHGAKCFPNKQDRWAAPYPPLTYASSYYLPRWLLYTAMGFFIGSIGAAWFGFAHPFRMGAVIGLAFWTIEHFEATYRSIPKPR